MTRTSGATALVLGGGGITGIAWEVGILVGLARAGVDVTDAETVVGTSAGSVVGSQVTSGQPLESLYAEQLAPPDEEIGGRLGRLAALAIVERQPQDIDEPFAGRNDPAEPGGDDRAALDDDGGLGALGPGGGSGGT